MDPFETRKNSAASLSPAVALAAAALFFLAGIPGAQARNIYLNGVDVSSSRSQELRNVQIRINEKGDIFISAPHYQVTEEDFFTPLARVGAPPTPPGVNTGPSVAAREKAKEAAPDAPRDVMKAPVEPASDAPVGQSVGARSDGPVNAANGRGASRQGGDSNPPVLDATPPATGTSPASRSSDPNSK